MIQLNFEGICKLLRRCNNFKLKGSPKMKFVIDGQILGLIRNDMVDLLTPFHDVFLINSNSNELTINPKFKSYEERTGIIRSILNEIRKLNHVEFIKGWRNETYVVYSEGPRKAWFEMERSCTGIFGVTRLGVHVTGYTLINNQYYVWTAKRSSTKQTNPGKIDNLVGGGCNSKLSIHQNVLNECYEEAGLRQHSLKNLKSAGCISFIHDDYRGIMPQIIYSYDLLLANDFTPVNTDGEVESFELVDAAKLGELIVTEEFKYDSALVNLDFLMRHGIIEPDFYPDYYSTFQAMHSSVQFD